MLALQPCHPQEKIFCMIIYIILYLINIYIEIDSILKFKLWQVGQEEGFTINLLST